MRINTQYFRTLWRTAAAISPARSPRDVLRYIAFGCQGERCCLMATDGEVYLQIGSDCQPRQLLPADRVSQILSAIEDENITITTEAIGTDRDTFVLQAPPIDEFPQLAECSVDRWYTVDAGEFRAALAATLPACDPDSARYALAGVLLDFTSSETLTVVATDSRRLVATQVPCECAGDPDRDVRPVIPQRSVKTLVRLLDRGDECRFGFGLSGGIVFECGDARLTCQECAGRFPEWQKIAAAASRGATFDLPAGELLSAVRSAAIVTAAETRAVTVSITTAGISASGAGADIGTADITRQLELLGECEFRIDPDYLTDGLKPVSDCEVTLAHNGSDGAVHFSHDGGWQFLLMPMVTNE